MEVNQAKGLRQLREENAKLKKKVGEQAMEIGDLRFISSKSGEPGTKAGRRGCTRRPKADIQRGLPTCRASTLDLALRASRAERQSGCVESFHDKMRDEFLQAESFATVAEARVLLENWRKHYTEIRPHSSLGYLTPNELAASPCGADSAPLHQPGRGSFPSHVSLC